MRLIAVVPVKKTSDRVKDKNFCEFVHGKSLLDLLLSKLGNCSSIDEVYVSSDNLAISDTVVSRGFKFIERSAAFCNNDVGWSEVITHVIGSIPEEDNVVIAWCHTTSPLFGRYSEAIDAFSAAYSAGENDGLVTVHARSDFLLNQQGRPLNYSWGVWHPYSQDLEPLCAVTGALFIATKKTMLENRYVISRNPLLFHTSDYESVDVDTPFDFQLARLMASHKEVLAGS